MNSTPGPWKVGDVVGYDYMPALMSYRGTITKITPGPHGGNCFVRWGNNQYESEQCSINLRKLEGGHYDGM